MRSSAFQEEPLDDLYSSFGFTIRLVISRTGHDVLETPVFGEFLEGVRCVL